MKPRGTPGIVVYMVRLSGQSHSLHTQPNNRYMHINVQVFAYARSSE
jgi:hypothetical protein